MQINVDANSATLLMNSGEVFFLKRAFFTGNLEFERCWIPPHPTGSWIARLLHGWYFGLRRVESHESERRLDISGVSPRGTFYALDLAIGERIFVNPRSVVGFCSKIANISTVIRFGFASWLLRKHFFTIFTGPGMVMIYSQSPIKQSNESSFAPKRVLSFDVARRFRPATPVHRSLPDRAYNLISREVAWEFVDSGTAIVESQSPADKTSPKHPFRRIIEIIVSFILP